MLEKILSLGIAHQAWDKTLFSQLQGMYDHALELAFTHEHYSILMLLLKQNGKFEPRNLFAIAHKAKKLNSLDLYLTLLNTNYVSALIVEEETYSSLSKDFRWAMRKGHHKVVTKLLTIVELDGFIKTHALGFISQAIQVKNLTILEVLLSDQRILNAKRAGEIESQLGNIQDTLFKQQANQLYDQMNLKI